MTIGFTATPRAGTIPTPSAQASVWAVFEHRVVGYRRVWRGTVLSSFLLPVLTFLGIGLSVGAYVNRSGTLGVPYLDYIAPGLLMSSALQVAVGESTWPVFGGFAWNRLYHGMRATPVRPPDMVGGELAFITLRVGLAGAGFLLIMLMFGTVHSWWGLAALPVSLLLGLAGAAPVLAYTASISSDNMFAMLFGFGVIPMTLFAGVFFPVSAMPVPARALAYASPLWSGVELARAATLGGTTAWGWSAHVGYLVIWAVGGYLLARARFSKRLGN
jgi:lipooligosaccharide transport system permease protein